MEHTKAGFKALRETVGYTISELAEVLQVNERTARRWEGMTDTKYYGAPPGVWEWLEEARARQIDRENDALAVYYALIDEGERPDAVELPYYQSQSHYETTRREDGDEEERYTVANATNRHIAERLADEGVEVRFVFPRN